MGSNGKSSVACPTCGALVVGRPADFPFCTLRCRLADLGKWLDEDYRIPGEPVGVREGNTDPD